MLRLIARWWAKVWYLLRLEFEGATAEINAKLSGNRAAERRALAEQLNSEADEIEENIKRLSEMEVVGYWLCERGHESATMPVSFDSKEVVLPPKDCYKCHAPVKRIRRSEMSGQEQYESDREKRDAEKIIEQKRAQAKSESEHISGGEQTAQM
jgi:hypothetical protein